MNNPIKPTGNRFYYLDNLCAMMVLHMIFTVHVSWSVGYRPEVIKFISTTLGCFMSWFFFKAGMMHRDGDTVSFVKKSFKRLIVPYFTFLVIGLLIDGLTSYIQQGHALNLALFARNELVTVLNNQILVPTAASWFLLSLFIVRITYHILYKKSTPPPM